jgi:hypothetical protein
MAKAILIDPRDASIRYVECAESGDAMRAMIGGDLEIAHVFPSGDVLYVDEEGLTKDFSRAGATMQRASVFTCIRFLLEGDLSSERMTVVTWAM